MKMSTHILAVAVLSIAAMLATSPAAAVDIIWTDNVNKQILRGAADGSGSASELFGIADYPGGPPGSIEPQWITVVPEPNTFALAGFGLIGLLAYGWRRRRA